MNRIRLLYACVAALALGAAGSVSSPGLVTENAGGTSLTIAIGQREIVGVQGGGCLKGPLVVRGPSGDIIYSLAPDEHAPAACN